MLVTIPRREFIEEVFWCRPGEHLTALAPNGGGKTVLCYELAEQVISPKFPAISLVMKPRDKEVTAWAKRLRFRTVRHWPPMPSPWAAKPPGWVLWPKHSFDPAKDDPMLWREFRAAIIDSYKRGNRLLFADEILGLTDLGLERELNAVWTRARTMGTSLWGASQRPSGIPLHAYAQASHIFLGVTPEERDVKRYTEIGGVDAKLVKTVVMGLQRFQFLYIRRYGRNGAEMCVIDKN